MAPAAIEWYAGKSTESKYEETSNGSTFGILAVLDKYTREYWSVRKWFFRHKVKTLFIETGRMVHQVFQ